MRSGNSNLGTFCLCGYDRIGGHFRGVHVLSRRYILYFNLFYEFNFFDIVNVNIKRTTTLNFINIKKNTDNHIKKMIYIN